MPARYHPWYLDFLLHWTFALELAIVIAAAWRVRRRRAGAAPRVAATLLLLMLLALGAACHRPTRPAPAPAALPEEHCWWTVFRTPLRADTVAARFARAFAAAGLGGAAWSQRADTAWAHAGPTRLGGKWGDGVYEARAVAYQLGDSAHYRYFVALRLPATGSADEPNEGARRIPFCGAIARAAAVGGTAAPQPGAEERLELWLRRLAAGR